MCAGKRFRHRPERVLNVPRPWVGLSESPPPERIGCSEGMDRSVVGRSESARLACVGCIVTEESCC